MLFNKKHLQYLMYANGIHEDWRCDPHHFLPRGQGGPDHITNCVLIPREWHDEYHFGNRAIIYPKIERLYKKQQRNLQRYLKSNNLFL